MQDDVNDVLVEEGGQFGTPGEFEDLVRLRLGAFYFLQLLGGSDFSFFCRSRWLARQRHDFCNFEACRLHDVLQVARAQPAHGLAQTPEGGGRDVHTARQPKAEHHIVAGSGTDAVGGQQAGDLLDIQGILQRGIRVDVARCLQRQGEGKRLGLIVGRLSFADWAKRLARRAGD